MRRTISATVAVAAALAAAAGLVTPFYESLSIFEAQRRYDVFIALLSVSVAVFGILEIAKHSRTTSLSLLATTAGLFGITSFWLIEIDENSGAGQWLFAAAAVASVVAVVLMILEELEPATAATTAAPPPRRAPAPAPPAPNPPAPSPPVPVTAAERPAAPPAAEPNGYAPVVAPTAPAAVVAPAPPAPAPAPQPQPAAGWYPNPAGTGYRWWDGTEWTDEVSPPG